MSLRTKGLTISATIILAAATGAAHAGSFAEAPPSGMHKCFHSGTAYCRTQVMRKNRVALKKKMQAARAISELSQDELTEYLEERATTNAGMR